MPKFNFILSLLTGLCLLLTPGCAAVDEKKPSVVPEAEYSIVQKSDSISVLRLRVSKNSAWVTMNPRFLHWPVYRLEQGDVNQDGNPDALVGVIKKTKYDPMPRKRLFIFTLHQKAIVPLWMGSRLHQPLKDFHLLPFAGKPIVKTIEVQQNGLYSLNEYEYGSFGLNYIRTVKTDLDSARANYFLNHETF